LLLALLGPLLLPLLPPPPPPPPPLLLLLLLLLLVVVVVVAIRPVVTPVRLKARRPPSDFFFLHFILAWQHPPLTISGAAQFGLPAALSNHPALIGVSLKSRRCLCMSCSASHHHSPQRSSTNCCCK
jgi:hypothetical protein